MVLKQRELIHFFLILMAWLKTGDDDWLVEPDPNFSNHSNSVRVAADEPQDITLDLTSADAIEALHTLPEAPACDIRMFTVPI